MKATQLVLFFVVGLLIHSTDSKSAIITGISNWYQRIKACQRQCHIYYKFICAFDIYYGYILADNKCLLYSYNICHRTNYTECFDDTCSKLLNLTIPAIPPVSYLTNKNYY